MGDNGFFLGERQISGKWLMYENSIRVPLVIYDPRNVEHKDVDNMALNIDIPSTILDYANIEAPKHWHGTSLKPLTEKNNTKKTRDTILIEHIWDFEHIPASEGVRTEEWKYFRYVENKSIEELYNIKEDPREINNLVKDLNYQETLGKLRSKCDELIIKYQDPMSVAPQAKVFDIKSSPKFSWNFDKSTYEQMAYQIIVSSNINNCTNNIGDIWDTDKVISETTQGISFNGAKLVSNKEYFYKLRLWDNLNRIGQYSSPKKFVYR
jgi:hypothetical protein